MAARRARPSPRLTLALLFLAGALISGFTILRGIDPFDEGLMLQAARRTADGQWVYRDFLWSYGPGNILLLGGAFKLFGTSLLWWRIARVAVDALVALVVFVVLRRSVDMRWALVGWLTAACAMAEPTSANPFPLALLFGLLAVVVAAESWTAVSRSSRLLVISRSNRKSAKAAPAPVAALSAASASRCSGRVRKSGSTARRNNPARADDGSAGLSTATGSL